MDLKEAIEKRISRRSYTGEEMSLKEKNRINGLIDRINRTTGMSIELIEDGSSLVSGMKGYGFFKNVKEVIVLKGKKDIKNLKEKVGYYGEIIVLEAEKLNLGTCWVGGTYDRKSKLVDVSEDEVVVSLITIGKVQENTTLKENVIRKMIHRKSKSIYDMSDCDMDMPDWFVDGMKSVVRAPSAINSQKTVISLKNGIVYAGIAMDYPFDEVDLGIAKLHFEIICGGNFEWGNNGVWNAEEKSDYTYVL